jgi:hypothetical protein
MLPAAVQAQFIYTTNNDGSLNIYQYTGPGGAVIIPGTNNDLAVTSIGYEAFLNCYKLFSVTIPSSVTSIGDWAFANCGLTSVTIGTNVTSIGAGAFADTSLTQVTIPNGVTNIGVSAFNGDYDLTNVTIGSSVISIGEAAFTFTKLANIVIPNSVTSIGNNAFNPCTNLTSITIGNSVTSIGSEAFNFCINLTSITIPNSVTSIGSGAFASCFNLTRVYFEGNAPNIVAGFAGSTTIYYLPGTTGWSSPFAGHPTVPWYLPNPTILNFEPNFGVQTNQFGFIISWATNISVVVEACTNLANSTWSSVTTNTLTGGWCYFSDPQWTNYPGRFYRLRSP